MRLNVDTVAVRRSLANRDILFAVLTRFVARDETAADNFRRHCLPSMLNQTVKPHAWIVLFNKDLTPPGADLFSDLLDHEWIVPMLCDDDWAERHIADIREMFGLRFAERNPAYVCCTRLDVAGALRTDFHAALDAAIAKLRRRWTPDTSLCLNFPYGATWAHGRLSISLREKTVYATVDPYHSFLGPYRCPRLEIDQHLPVVNVHTNRPMFVFRRHGGVEVDDQECAAFDEFAHPDRVLRSCGLGAS